MFSTTSSYILVSADDDRAMSVVYDVVRDGAEDGSSNGSEPTCSHNNHIGGLIMCCFNQSLSRLAVDSQVFSGDLQHRYTVKSLI